MTRKLSQLESPRPSPRPSGVKLLLSKTCCQTHHGTWYPIFRNRPVKKFRATGQRSNSLVLTMSAVSRLHRTLETSRTRAVPECSAARETIRQGAHPRNHTTCAKNDAIKLAAQILDCRSPSNHAGHKWNTATIDTCQCTRTVLSRPQVPA